MTRLRAILAANMRTYRKEQGLSQFQLASLVDTAPNYIAMIEAEKRFPSDTMLERIAFALKKEPFQLFSIISVQKDWQQTVLTEMADFVVQKLKETH